MKKSMIFFFLILIAIVAYNGIYTIESGEETVITRFGEYARTETQAGLKWKIPLIEQRYTVNVAEVRRLEFGFATANEADPGMLPSYDRSLSNNSLMLTGDENLVNVEAIVQFRVSDSKKFLFNVDDQIGTLNTVAVSTIRRSVANNNVDEVLTDNKVGIQQEIRGDLQGICDSYGIGLQITAVQLQDVYPPKEVDDSFKDISRAKADKESKINEALSYENRVIPDARGEASKLISEAEAYREDRIRRANGDVANFNAVYEKYVFGKAVTRTRLYLETLEEVLPGMEIYIVGEDGNTLKFLPLQGVTGEGGIQ
ncbi:MAG: FtsH protease activity modulator HflK [Peptostreptococcaceae bacterium]|nr:FtsH protease activity modulator HflK [Peptostreptococcaceae bacterium]